MTPEKVLEVLNLYERMFIEADVSRGQVGFGVTLNADEESTKISLEHCHGMIDEMRQFVAGGRMDKVFRWLGFIQGVLWVNGWYTLAELMDHNRPPDSTFDASK